MDIWSKSKRSDVMSKIKGKNTKPEILLRSALFKLGYRFRIHDVKLPGKPDIVFPKYKTVVFVHGCFWHFHDRCNEGKIPKSNEVFWREKLHKNKLKDDMNLKAIVDLGWNPIVVWECEIEKQLPLIVERLTFLFKENTKSQ